MVLALRTESRRRSDRAREEGFLTPDRRRTLEGHAGGTGDAYLCRGRLVLVRPWKRTGEAELARLHEEIGLLARGLVGRGSLAPP